MAADPLAGARRLVVKIGSSLLIEDASGGPARAWLGSVAADIARLRSRGMQVVIVSSGAVALGRRVLGLQGALRLEEKQAAAAAGQPRLMRAYEDAFAPYDAPVAQALLTPDDTERRRRWLNARATLLALLAHGAAPIINENDTVATAELRYGDNDRLAARVAQMIGADMLVLLSDVDGLYDRDPRRDPAAQRLERVAAITPDIEAMAGAAGSPHGSGGMRTKLEAAKIAAAAGCATIIMAGGDDSPFLRLAAGAPHTLFAPAGTPKQAYKAWIAGALAPKGSVRVDGGAAQAIRAGKSLLPAGVTGVEGAFEKGDAIRILDTEGRELARGLARYDASEARLMMGRKSSEIETLIGYTAGPALVHADDVAVA